jgi:hypothetical protein
LFFHPIPTNAFKRTRVQGQLLLKIYLCKRRAGR